MPAIFDTEDQSEPLRFIGGKNFEDAVEQFRECLERDGERMPASIKLQEVTIDQSYALETYYPECGEDSTDWMLMGYFYMTFPMANRGINKWVLENIVLGSRPSIENYQLHVVDTEIVEDPLWGELSYRVFINPAQRHAIVSFCPLGQEKPVIEVQAETVDEAIRAFNLARAA